MANRYWVGNTDLWDGTAGSKWATTSGGSGGSAVPTSSDDVFFDANSGLNTITVSAAANCNNLNFTGFIGTFDGSTNTQVFGSLTFSSGMTLGSGNNGNIIFKATSGTNIITSNGQTFNYQMEFNGIGGTWQLADNLTLTDQLILTNGIFTANNKNVTCLKFDSSNANVRTITMGSGTWTLTGNGAIWDTSTTTNLTLNANTSTIKVTNSSITASTFFGGSLTFYNYWNASTGSGMNIIRDSNTFNDLKINAGKTQHFQTATTNTVTTFTALGTSGNHIILSVEGGATAFTLSKSAGTVNVNYCDIDHSTATGGATWNDLGGTDNGNNTGWNFLAAPPGANQGNFLAFM